MRSSPFARKSGCLHICLHNEDRVLSNILSYVVCINHKDTFLSDNKLCAQWIIEFKDEKKSNRKYKFRPGAFIS